MSRGLRIEVAESGRWCDDGLQISIQWEREEAAALVGKALVLELRDGEGYVAFTVSGGGKVNAVGGIQESALTDNAAQDSEISDWLR